MNPFKSLGNKVGLQPKPDKHILEVFSAPPTVDTVTFETDEFTSLCPITGQPDFADVKIEYTPDKLCVESKSLKLYLQSFRQEGAFIESLAHRICEEFFFVVRPLQVTVTISSVPRGGLALEAKSSVYKKEDE